MSLIVTVDDCKHYVHEDVQVDYVVHDEEQGKPPTGIIGRHPGTDGENVMI